MTYYIDLIDKRNLFVKNFLQQNGKDIKKFEENFNILKGDTLIFAPNKKFTKEFLTVLPNNITIFAGNIDNSYKEILKSKKITFLNLLTDEIFAIKNSQLTAEGILANILTYCEKSLYENNILILGSGRVGKATAQLFEKIGINYSLVSHSKQNYENNFYYSKKNYFGNEFLKDLHKFDVIINTIPASILSNEDIKKINSDCLFLEIASIQTLPCENLDFTYLLCPALPQKYSAETAGKFMAECILKLEKI